MSKRRKQNDSKGLPDETRSKILFRLVGTTQTMEEISRSLQVHPKTVAKIRRIYNQAAVYDYRSMVRECVRNNNTADVRWACDLVGVPLDRE